MVEVMEKQVIAMLKKHAIEPDTYDFKSIWDSSLTAVENFDLLRSDLKEKGMWKETMKEFIDEVQARAKEVEAQQISMLKENEEKLLESIKNTDFKGVEIECFKPAKELVLSLINGKGFGGFGLILESEAGFGKSFLVESTLKSSNVKYVKLSGHTTPLGFFTFLQKNNDKDIILIDDISMNDLRDNTFKSMLKSILWKTDEKAKRVLQWSSFRTEQELNKNGFLSVFEVKPKFILICNKFPENEDSNAIKSRCLYKKINFTRKEKLEIMYSIAQNINYESLTQEQKNEVVDYIKENTAVYTKGLDIRTLIKSFYLRGVTTQWKKLIDNMFEINEELKEIDTGMVCKEWCDTFGKSRASYFRAKRKYQSLIGGKSNDRI